MEELKLMGLRFDVVAKDGIHYLLFYDIDRPELEQSEIEEIDRVMHIHQISYILYRTKHGYHLVGLTPLNHTQWASAFGTMKQIFDGYYGGVVIRLSRKKDEQQELVMLEQEYGEVIPNLYNLYCTRFNLPKKPWIKETSKYLLVFEVYRSKKE